jgi:hypothetical protein
MTILCLGFAMMTFVQASFVLLALYFRIWRAPLERSYSVSATVTDVIGIGCSASFNQGADRALQATPGAYQADDQVSFH